MKAFTATEAKNSFGTVLDTVLAKGGVVVTKHDRPAAYILSKEVYYMMVSRLPEDALEPLREDMARLVARMQTPKAKAAGHALFAADSGALGAVAVAVGAAESVNGLHLACGDDEWRRQEQLCSGRP